MQKHRKIVIIVSKIVLGLLALIGFWSELATWQNAAFRLFGTYVALAAVVYYFVSAAILALRKHRDTDYNLATRLNVLIVANLCFLLGGAIIFAITDSTFPTAAGFSGIIICYILPIFSLIDWLVYGQKGDLKPIDPLYFCAPALIYASLVLATASTLPATSPLRYPYEFLNYTEIGLDNFLYWSLIILTLQLAYGYILFIIDFAMSGQLSKHIVLPKIKTIVIVEDPRPIPNLAASATAKPRRSQPLKASKLARSTGKNAKASAAETTGIKETKGTKDAKDAKDARSVKDVKTAKEAKTSETSKNSKATKDSSTTKTAGAKVPDSSKNQKIPKNSKTAAKNTAEASKDVSKTTKDAPRTPLADQKSSSNDAKTPLQTMVIPESVRDQKNKQKRRTKESPVATSSSDKQPESANQTEKPAKSDKIKKFAEPKPVESAQQAKSAVLVESAKPANPDSVAETASKSEPGSQSKSEPASEPKLESKPESKLKTESKVASRSTPEPDSAHNDLGVGRLKNLPQKTSTEAPDLPSRLKNLAKTAADLESDGK